MLLFWTTSIAVANNSMPDQLMLNKQQRHKQLQLVPDQEINSMKPEQYLPT